MMDPTSLIHCINFKVLFGKQGFALTTAEAEETKISTARALQILAK